MPIIPDPIVSLSNLFEFCKWYQLNYTLKHHHLQEYSHILPITCDAGYTWHLSMGKRTNVHPAYFRLVTIQGLSEMFLHVQEQ